MIQDIEPEVFHNEYDRPQIKPEDTVFAFDGRTVLSKVTENGAVCFPTAGDIQAQYGEILFDEGKRNLFVGPDQADCLLQFVFRIDDRAFFLYLADEKLGLDGYSYEPNSVLRKAQPKDLCFAAMTAIHLNTWYRDNHFCGRCGHHTVVYDKERALKCPECGNIIYPKICPAVIVGVVDGDKIMMTRYAGREYKGNALIAGFCEIGERAEETVKREVMEEVGLKVKDIRYFDSQPWGFDSNLLLGYFCTVDGSRDVCIDEDELSHAVWVSRDEIGEENASLSLTATMIMHFKNHPELF